MIPDLFNAAFRCIFRIA